MFVRVLFIACRRKQLDSRLRGNDANFFYWLTRKFDNESPIALKIPCNCVEDGESK